MIITLTPNPAVDQTVWVDRLELGGVNRPRSTELDPAGKGVNVSRMIHRLGWPTVAFGFVGGETGRIVERSLDEEGVQHHFVRIPDLTRVNTTIVETGERRTATSLYGPGPTIAPDQLEALTSVVRFWLQAGRVLVLAGSLPPGTRDDFYKDLIQLAREGGAKVILDTDGEPLRVGIEAQPDLIKPNIEEAERLLGRKLPDRDAAIGGARELVGRGIGAVVLSLGAQGALCARGDEVWHALPPRVERRSTVGSGDSMVAGLAVSMARGEPLVEGLRLGTAAGAATATSAGTSRGQLDQIRALIADVKIERIR